VQINTLSICVVLIAVTDLLGGCQKREPTKPAQPTVAAARATPASAEARPRGGAKMSAIAESVRRRHFDLP
jgi:hypothetical protein